MSCATIISPIEVLSADDLGRRWDWSDEEKVRIVEESLQGFRQGSPPAASCDMTAPPRSEDDKTIEIGLPNGRRLTIPASLDPTILARLLPVLDAP